LEALVLEEDNELHIIADVDVVDIVAAEIERKFFLRPIRRILLVNPPDQSGKFFDLDAAKKRRYSAYPPNGLLVLARQLRSCGFSVQVLDLNFVVLSGHKPPARISITSVNGRRHSGQLWKASIPT